MYIVNRAKGGVNMKISIDYAAHQMGVSPSFLRAGLQRGAFPFGTAYKNDNRWSYYIFPAKFQEYIGSACPQGI